MHTPADADVVEPDADLDGLLLTGSLEGRDASSAHLLECRLEGCDLTGLRAPRARLTDTVLYAVRGAGVDLADTTWMDCTVEDARLGAVELHGAELRRVRFTGGKVDYLNLRGATLRDVVFENVVLTDLDLGDATLAGVTFEGCRLAGPDFTRARLTRVDLSTAHLAAPRGLSGLAGATISRLQLLDLAEAFALEAGVRVVDPTAPG
ncbi:MAG TPA: pentapeptide repeat-containing protein [Pedococcus sp.]